MKIPDFLKSRSWLEGPTFLVKSEDEWPTYYGGDVIVDLVDPEVRKDTSVNIIVNESLDATDQLMTYFSDWKRLKVSVAWFLRLKTILLELSRKRKDLNPSAQAGQVKRLKPKVNPESHILTPKDLLEAELAIIHYGQQHRFKDESTSLTSETETVSRYSFIYKLDLILEDGLLRVGGRLSKGAMPLEGKHPLILSKEQHISTLILKEIHQLLGHSGRNHTLSALRTSANSAIRKIISACHFCRCYNG